MSPLPWGEMDNQSNPPQVKFSRVYPLLVQKAERKRSHEG